MNGSGRPGEKAHPQVRKAVAAAAVGNTTEWFDFGIYAYVAVMVGEAFFPSGNRAVELMAAFGVFAIAFLLRPIGGFVFGPLGDRWGRQRVLVLTILLMSGATFFMGLLPTYHQIGLLAPILFLLLRMTQGFAAGGEYGGAATYIAESAPTKRRGFYGSFLELGTLSGFALGAGIPTVLILTLSEADMFAWGWRIPFLIAGPLGAVGLYLRAKLEDTPAFTEMSKEHKSSSAPFAEIWKYHWRRLLILIGVVVILNIGNYTLLTYMETYLAEVLNVTKPVALFSVLLAILLMGVLVVPVGSLSDRIGRKPLMMSACVCYLVLPVPAFWLIIQGSWLSATAGLVMLALSQVQMLGVLAATLPALFPTQVRYGGFSIGYNISTSLFGGTAPLVIQALVTWSGSDLAPAFYLMAAAAVSFIPIMLIPETAGRPLITESAPGKIVQPTV